MHDREIMRKIGLHLTQSILKQKNIEFVCSSLSWNQLEQADLEFSIVDGFSWVEGFL